MELINIILYSRIDNVKIIAAIVLFYLLIHHIANTNDDNQEWR